jgi:hypothetical protein
MMRSVQHGEALTRHQLEAMAKGQSRANIDDMEFFETLAHNHCLVMPPWVYRVNGAGRLEEVTPVRYTDDYQLDKPSILLALMKRLPHSG